MFYVLGMSYGAVAIALSALGWPLSTVAVYYAVQEAGAAVAGPAPRPSASPAASAIRTNQEPSVRCAGQWLTVGIGVDAVRGTVLSLDLLPNGEAATLTAWVQDLASVLGATLLVSDDADSFKLAADANGMDQQVCKAHVGRNTDAWVEAMAPDVVADADGSLASIGVAPAQAVADIHELRRLMSERQPSAEASAALATIHHRYLSAAKPAKGEAMSLAYRLRLFSLDRWNLWPRLTRYRTWAGPDGDTLDGTTTACERAIGWWVKERCRSMRGDKRPESVLHVSRLFASMCNAFDGSGFVLAELDPDRFQTAHNQAKAELLTAKAREEEARLHADGHPRGAGLRSRGDLRHPARGPSTRVRCARSDRAARRRFPPPRDAPPR